MTGAALRRLPAAAGAARLRLDRPASGNTLTGARVESLHAALDEAEGDPDCRVVVLEGAGGVFSIGMDLEEFLAGAARVERFPELLGRLAASNRVVISAVDGKVMAGGVGLVAASDLVYATGRATFTLSETLWGLLPCVVMPYLVRRVGFQRAYEMTLTARTVPAEEAAGAHLVDALVEDLETQVGLAIRRLTRLDPATVADAKAYFRKLWILSEATERTALDELTRLLATDRVRRNIEDYARTGRLPWESW